MKTLLMRKIKDKEIKVMCHQFSGMINSGCDLISCFNTLIQSSSQRMSVVLMLAKRNLERGKSLTESFALTNSFSTFFISMVFAGEMSGKLDYIFERMSKYYDREYKLKNKLLRASVYPIILTVVSMAALIFMLVFVIPNFETSFLIEGANIPNATKRVFQFSKFIKGNLLYILVLLPILLCVLIKIAKGSEEFKSWIDKMKFSIPKLKKICHLVLSDKFSRSLSILMGSGVNITESIAISIRVVDNRYIESKMKIATEYIGKGNSVTNALKATGIFPDMFISMLSSGEETGRFDSCLDSVSKYYEEELDIELETFMKIVEPVLIVFMGLIIGSVLVSVLLPMFDVISSIA